MIHHHHGAGWALTLDPPSPWSWLGAYIDDAISHKKEEDFSDHLKKFLDMTLTPEGVIINREVVLNRGRNGEAGARTDIWIDALIKETSEKLSLCIEVKGSWNRSAPTAMKEQLVDKYMGNGGADVGILLVGWFQSHKVPQKNMWEDNRDMARAELEQQAAKLTQSGYLIKVSAQPAPSGFEADSVVCSVTNRNNGRTAWDVKDEIIGRRNCQNIGTAV